MTPSEILATVDRLTPSLQRAYLEQVRVVAGSVTLIEVERMLREHDEEGLVALLALGAMAAFIEASRAAFIAGASAEVASAVLPRGFGRFELDTHAPTVVNWLTSNAAAIRQEADGSVREAVRAAIEAQKVTPAAPASVAPASAVPRSAPPSPRQTALDLVGRVSPQTGKRTGGLLGLSGDHVKHVQRARQQLLSGDPEDMRKYLTRMRRDRRFDGIVKRAIEAAKPVSAADVDKITGRYAERLLATHSQMLAETEALEAFGAGRDAVHEQLIERGLDRSSITKTWRTRQDGEVRHTHRGMNGQEVPFDQPFRSPSGALLRYPGDTGLGAGWSEVARCRCSVIYKIGGR